MEEWTKEQWNDTVQQHDKVAFYLYTPMCGTCAVASKMMDVVKELVPQVPMGKANINFLGTLPFDYEIESVPCLLITEKGEIQHKIYAFQSVPYLYEMLK